MTQPCNCNTQPDFLDIHPDKLEDFLAGFDQLEGSAYQGIYHLYACNACGGLWIIDDTTRGPMAVRVESESELIGFDERPYRRELCIVMHGGLSNTKCMYRGCEQHALRGGVFCVDHVYPQYKI